MVLKFHHTSNATHCVMSLFASFACNVDVLSISNGLHVCNCWSCINLLANMDVFAALLNAVASFIYWFRQWYMANLEPSLTDGHSSVCRTAFDCSCPLFSISLGFSTMHMLPMPCYWVNDLACKGDKNSRSCYVLRCEFLIIDAFIKVNASIRGGIWLGSTGPAEESKRTKPVLGWC